MKTFGQEGKVFILKPIYSGNTGFLNTCGSMKFDLRLSSSFVEV
jgi:hypothetical protein